MTDRPDILLKGENLTKYYSSGSKNRLTACLDVSLELFKGETLGIVGESGCGKSTLLRLLTQLEQPDEGKLYFQGKEITHLKGEELRKHRRQLQMVFQDPASSFFARMMAGQAVIEPLINYDTYSREERIKKQAELLELVQLPKEYAKRYPHSMSGGQRQRLAIARALALEPEILICDEATAALDVSIQKQIVELLADLQQKRGLSIIFVCHDLALVQLISHRVMVMYLGCVVEILPGKSINKQALHPYTKALLDSVFSLDMDFLRPIDTLKGEIPSPLERPGGCPFHTRCPSCVERCRSEMPDLKHVSADHQVACHLV